MIFWFEIKLYSSFWWLFRWLLLFFLANYVKFYLTIIILYIYRSQLYILFIYLLLFIVISQKLVLHQMHSLDNVSTVVEYSSYIFGINSCCKMRVTMMSTVITSWSTYSLFLVTYNTNKCFNRHYVISSI